MIFTNGELYIILTFANLKIRKQSNILLIIKQILFNSNITPENSAFIDINWRWLKILIA